MRKICLIVGVLAIYFSPSVRAQVLFEGYSRITQQGIFLGFAVQRYEFDAGRKQFISTSLLKMNDQAGSVTESLKAYANEAFEPINYIYNRLSPSAGVFTIEATNQGGVLKITQREGGKTSTRTTTLPKGAFFSTFLAYVILKNPHGMKSDSQYEYQAVAEEEGALYSGLAVVKAREKYKGLDVFKVENKFPIENKIPRDVYVSYTNEKGEMLATMAPQRVTLVELMPDSSQAMGGMTVSADNLRLLFGNVPEGKINAIAAAGAAVSAAGTPDPGGLTTKPKLPSGKAAPVPPATISKPSSLKSLEVQEVPAGEDSRKQGTRQRRGILTKPK